MAGAALWVVRALGAPRLAHRRRRASCRSCCSSRSALRLARARSCRGALPALGARRRPLLARAHPRPAVLRARAPGARAEESRRPRAAAARVPAALLASDGRPSGSRSGGRGCGQAKVRTVHAHDHSRVRGPAAPPHRARADPRAHGGRGRRRPPRRLARAARRRGAHAHRRGRARRRAHRSRLATRPARGPWTFGLGRAEILAAQANGHHAPARRRLDRLRRGMAGSLDPPDVRGGVVLVVALAGVAVNLVATVVLARGDRESLNMRGAFLHVATDLAAFAAPRSPVRSCSRRAGIASTRSPALLVAALMFRSSWSLLRDSGRIFLEASPAGIDPAAVARALADDADVVERARPSRLDGDERLPRTRRPRARLARCRLPQRAAAPAAPARRAVPSAPRHAPGRPRRAARAAGRAAALESRSGRRTTSAARPRSSPAPRRASAARRRRRSPPRAFASRAAPAGSNGSRRRSRSSSTSPTRQAARASSRDAVEQLGGLDILFNNAGLALGRYPFDESNEEDESGGVRRRT